MLVSTLPAVLIGAAVLLIHGTAATGVVTVFALIAIGLPHHLRRRPSQLHTAVRQVVGVASLACREIHPWVVGAVVLVQLAVVVAVGRLVTRAADSVLDRLTGLSSRHGVREHLERAGASAHQSGGPWRWRSTIVSGRQRPRRSHCR